MNKSNYIITPFTVHSDDWLVTQLYAYYKSHNRPADADRIGKAFIQKALDYFDYIETLTSKKAGRDVKQIYLMHDNLLNTDYLPQLIDALKQKGYHFISLDEAMTDPIYQRTDYFKEKFGISWVYRWIKDRVERNELINKGPQTTVFEKELKEIQSTGNK